MGGYRPDFRIQSLACQRRPKTLQSEHEMQWVSRRCLERGKMQVEVTRRWVLRMDKESHHSDLVRSRDDSADGVDGQRSTESSTLFGPIGSQPCEKRCRNWVPRYARPDPHPCILMSDGS